MIDRGANPFVVDYKGDTWADETRNLSNLQRQKSVFFTTRPIEGEFKDKTNFPESWFYENGVFDGKFESLIGQGASGTVLRGKWFGKKAAFKFVEIGTQEKQSLIDDALKSLDDKLSEMISIQATQGSKIVSFYGHYR